MGRVVRRFGLPASSSDPSSPGLREALKFAKRMAWFGVAALLRVRWHWLWSGGAEGRVHSSNSFGLDIRHHVRPTAARWTGSGCPTPLSVRVRRPMRRTWFPRGILPAQGPGITLELSKMDTIPREVCAPSRRRENRATPLPRGKTAGGGGRATGFESGSEWR